MNSYVLMLAEFVRNNLLKRFKMTQHIIKCGTSEKTVKRTEKAKKRLSSRIRVCFKRTCMIWKVSCQAFNDYKVKHKSMLPDMICVYKSIGIQCNNNMCMRLIIASTVGTKTRN